MSTKKQGYLYVLANSSMPGLVKVGRTTRLPSTRANELAGVTGVPTPFIVVLEQIFADCESAELFVHTQLERMGYRVSTNREFFRAPVNEVVRVIMTAPGILEDTEAESVSLTDPQEEGNGLISEDMPDELANLTLDNYRPPQPWDSIFEEAENYYYGLGEYIQDYDEALHLYQDAARLGSSLALERLGRMYSSGKGVSADNQKALDYYKETVKKGNYYGYAYMGDLFATQGHAENARKCYKAFFDARINEQDPSIEEYEQKFAWACWRYVLSTWRLAQPINFTDILEPAAQELPDLSRLLETLKNLKEGAILEGTVETIEEYGAFVDLGGIQGLVPLSEISHSRVSNPADRLQVGQTVAVKILKIDEQKKIIRMSLKALESDPWVTVARQLRERQIVTGRIVRDTDFGLFVELLPGIDGLLHISEIPRSQQGQLKEAAAGGAEITVMIFDIDPGKKRISLTLAPKGVTAGEVVKDTEVGAVTTGIVERVEPFGVFLRLGSGQIGLIANAEMGTQSGTDHRKDFGPGTEIKVVVVAIEEGGKRIHLSRSKALAQERKMHEEESCFLSEEIFTEKDVEHNEPPSAPKSRRSWLKKFFNI